ncbi:hypothetical protein LguiB_001722 [Lonicera macranthoides]
MMMVRRAFLSTPSVHIPSAPSVYVNDDGEASLRGAVMICIKDGLRIMVLNGLVMFRVQPGGFGILYGFGLNWFGSAGVLTVIRAQDGLGWPLGDPSRLLQIRSDHGLDDKGVASPLDGNVYAFGRLLNNHPIDRYPDTYRGLVFDPSSRSWNPCPPPTDLDYGYKSVVVVHNEHENRSTSRLVVFNYPRVPKAFNIATTQWENAFSAYSPIPVRNYDDDEFDPTPTSVGVGNLIYRFTRRKLYALDTSSPKPFKRVCGLNNKVPTYRETYGRPFLVYLGKGKLCIIWGCYSNSIDDAPLRILHITCLKFWVGMDNRKNRLRAVINRCDRFIAHGDQLYDAIAF